MLGTPGSNPLELFWDVVDELDQALDERVAIVESALKRQQFSFNVHTGEQEFMRELDDAHDDDDELARLSTVERKECWEAVSIACLVTDYFIVLTHMLWTSCVIRP
jgi:pre-mRNA-processing factor 40